MNHSPNTCSEIESIVFGLYSAEEIKHYAVCKVTSSKLVGPETVYDPRMGILDSDKGKTCVSCGLSFKECPGHFGYIELNEDIIHPLYHKMVVAFLKCFCFQCHRLIFSSEQLTLNGINRYSKYSRFNKVLDLAEKANICYYCNSTQPKIMYVRSEDHFTAQYKSGKSVAKIVLSTEDIKRVFDNIPNEDVVLLGFDPDLTHPKRLILSVLPVLPPCARPCIVAGSTMCDDDLTFQMCLGENVPVLLWNGTTKLAKNIQLGDRLIGDDGTPRTVLELCSGFGNLYEVIQRNGDSYIVNDGHKLTLRFSGHRQIFWSKFRQAWQMLWCDETKQARRITSNYRNPKTEALQALNDFRSTIPDNDTYDISLPDYLSMNISTQRMFKGIKVKDIHWERKEVDLDPYILGLWLGDGFRRGDGFASNDREIIEAWVHWARQNNAEVVHTGPHQFHIRSVGRAFTRTCIGSTSSSNETCNGCKHKICLACSNDEELLAIGEKRTLSLLPPATSRFIARPRGTHTNPLKSALAKYNLIKNKHIPIDYLVNDRITRLKVLAGLIDTDGHHCGSGESIHIVQSIPLHLRIINGAVFLARSLGFSCYVKDYANKTGMERRIFISGENIHEIPLLLERKKCIRVNRKDALTSRISVTPIGTGKYVGWKLDGNGRFLLGDFTVTHNCEIIKANNHLTEENLPEAKRQKYLTSLKFRIKTLFDNSGKKKAKHTNSRPIKAIKERLVGKDGLIRSNLMGKRVDQSARTVIGPGPHCRVGELEIPIDVAQNLTIPEPVNSFNYQELQDIVNMNKANFVIRGETRINLKYALFRKGTELLYGDVILRGKQEIKVTSRNFTPQKGDVIRRNGELITVELPRKKSFRLQIGDIVERQLRNGDVVLLNRYPTLHRGSMLAHTVVVRPYKTFRFSLATTKTFNADFDGDEMNIHIPQSYETQAELRYLSHVKKHFISAQASKSNLALIQDSLLGAYLMTKDTDSIPREQFYHICSQANIVPINQLNRVRGVLKSLGLKAIAFNGKGLFSILLPPSLCYTTKKVTIIRGVLIDGVLEKSTLGTSHNSLLQVVYKEYGEEVAITLIDNIQFIANQYLLYRGFSIGLEDCIATKKDEIENILTRSYIEAEQIVKTTHNKGIRESRINMALSKAKDIGMRIAKDALKPDNNFVATITAGSKGDYFNIAQITSLLGQQNVSGQRIIPTLNQGKRTLPHYPFEIKDPETLFESQGFIRHSFIEGLSPQEFYFHAMTGREGVSDTAMKTSVSGYLQRRMIKGLEDYQVQYNGTVCNSSGSVVQLAYGENGLDASQTIVKDGKVMMGDVKRLVQRLNLEYEHRNKLI